MFKVVAMRSARRDLAMARSARGQGRARYGAVASSPGAKRTNSTPRRSRSFAPFRTTSSARVGRCPDVLDPFAGPMPFHAAAPRGLREQPRHRCRLHELAGLAEVVV